MNFSEYKTGVRRGLPVGVGYFSVSFGFGAMAAAQGVKALDAALISLTNLTSAGQFAGLTLIVAAASLWAGTFFAAPEQQKYQVSVLS